MKNRKKIVRGLLLCTICSLTVTACIFSEFSEDYLQKTYEARVVSVIDGDTVKIRFIESVPQGCSEVETLRLIGIDTPELFDTVPEYFAEDAKTFTNLLYGKDVSIEFDSTSSAFDVYGRLLAYIRLESDDWKSTFNAYCDVQEITDNGTFLFNEAIILAGYAYYYSTYDFNDDYMNRFESAEETAQLLNRGLWK